VLWYKINRFSPVLVYCVVAD